MPHIALPEGIPGILSLMHYRPETAAPLNALAEVLLRGESSLSRGERELIAAHVSTLNGCQFCSRSHAAFAALQLPGGAALVEHARYEPQKADLSPKLKALLTIAGQVQQGGKSVTTEALATARAQGATDRELHDTVLIAAAFCMYNRYVDGLGTWAPTDAAAYEKNAEMIVTHGYNASTPR